MLTKIQYTDSVNRQTILDANTDKELIEEQNITEGNFLIFTTVGPIDNPITLLDYQTNKISQITDLYNQKLADGFTSSATGTPYIFGYASTDQMKFVQLAILVLSGMVVWPYKIRNKNGVDIPHTQAQYQALLIDIATFAQAQNVLEGNYFDRVNACTTIDDVNKIVVQF